MKKTKKGITEGVICSNQSQSQSPVGLMVMLALTKQKISLDTISKADKAFATEIALIIAEVMCLPPAAQIRVAGISMDARLVQEAYSLIEKEHVEHVMKSFREANYEIKHKKTYIRTALYNSVFEMQISAENEFSREV